MDFLLFRKMLTPYLIQLLFWIGVVTCVVAAIYNFGHHAIKYGLELLIGGPIFLRIFCEFLIIFFKINDSVVELKNAVQEKA